MEDEILKSSDFPQVDLEKLGKDLAGNMPEPSASALEESAGIQKSVEAARGAMPEKGSGGGTPIQGMTDEDGRVFDPRFHVSTADGQPVMNSKGWISKKRGGAQSQKKGETETEGSETPVVKSAEETSAEGCVEIYFETGASILGPEFMPPDEWPAELLSGYGFSAEQVAMTRFRQKIEASLAKVFQKQGTPAEMPPEVALCFAMFQHSMFVFRLAGPKKKVSGLWAKFQGWRAYRASLKKSGGSK